MSDLNLQDISKALKKIDICMMTTRDGKGAFESRPMSNNKDVDYEGDSYFFALEDTGAVRHLKEDPHIGLSYQGSHHFYVSVSGAADLSQDKAEMEAHWVKDLDEWFEDGIDTPGLTLIHVKARHIKYWNKMKEGEINL